MRDKTNQSAIAIEQGTEFKIVCYMLPKSCIRLVFLTKISIFSFEIWIFDKNLDFILKFDFSPFQFQMEKHWTFE